VQINTARPGILIGKGSGVRSQEVHLQHHQEARIRSSSMSSRSATRNWSPS
jgi:hypothetical protein